MKIPIYFGVVASILAAGFLAPAGAAPAAAVPGIVDTIVFGDTTSEKAHRFEGDDTKAVMGALGEPARVSLPKTPVDYYGGDLSFDLKVNPVAQNYFTVKFWGSDVNGGQKALLYINGEQLGYRHLGDYEALNHGADEPSFRGRFFYASDVLPLALTHGQKSLTLTIRTIGPISGYALGGGYDAYQGKMAAPSRSYYRAYTHTIAGLPGIEIEKQGAAPSPPPVRPPADGEAAMAAYRERINGHLNDLLRSPGRMSPGDINYLASALDQPWTVVGQDAASQQRAITQIVAKIDDQAQRINEPDVYAKGGYQADWGGVFAPIGEALFRIAKVVSLEVPLPIPSYVDSGGGLLFHIGKVIIPTKWQALLDENITVNGGATTRRDAWTHILKGNFDYARTHIARISNQAEICMYGAYRSNKGLEVINPAVAEPETTAKRFLFEPAGISPYLGNDILDSNGKLIGREKPFGENYYEVTRAGLTRENTYVAIYGEWTNILMNWWQLYGYDEILKKALINSDARAHMKYPDFDDEGYRAMRMEAVIESRGPDYPGNVGYGVRRNGGHGMDVARIERLMYLRPEKYSGAEWAPYWKLAADAVGYAQQFLSDNQYLSSISEADELQLPEDYEYVKHHFPVGVLLPTTNLSWRRPEERAAGLREADTTRFAWTDEDDGIVALRDGDTVLFAALVMKANWGVNGIARVHCITPTIDRVGTVATDVQFDPSGQYSIRDDRVNVQFWENEPPEGPHQALNGEALPIAAQPNVKVTQQIDTPYTGYANFYSLRYLGYLIGMNTTRAEYGNARPYSLILPAGETGNRIYDFVSGKLLPIYDGVVVVPPRSTVVLRLKGRMDVHTAPAATRVIAAWRGSDGVTVRWMPAAGATNYLVRRATTSKGSGPPLGPPITGNKFVDTSAPTTGNFFYTVAGVNQYGVGLASPPTGIITPSKELEAWLEKTPHDPIDPPEAAPGLAAENIKRRVNLTWKLARGGWTYNVLRSTTESGPFQPVSTGLKRTQFSQDGLEFGQRYFYRVAALNRNGTAGPQSPPVSIQPVDDTLRLPWKGTDIGPVGAEGSDGFLNDAFTVRGSGGDVWADADAFHYVYQPVEGDWTIVAHIASQDGANEWAKAGLMARESVDGGAKDIFVFRSPGHGVVMQNRRDMAGGTNGSPEQNGFGSEPWLKLTRRGDDFTSSVSKDGGHTWTEVGTVKVPMQRTALVGMAVTSHSHGALNRTVFDHVGVTVH